MPKALNTLYKPAFPEDTDQEFFKEWLDKNDHITPFFVERNTLSPHHTYLLEKQEDEWYHLKIAKNIKNIELFNIIQDLEKEFELEKFGSFEDFKNRVRVLIHLIIEKWWITENDIHKTIKDNNINLDEKELKKVKENNFSVQELRDIIKHFHGKGITYKELRNKNKKSLEKILSNEIKKKFENTFWYRWVKELQNIKTVTWRNIANLLFRKITLRWWRSSFKGIHLYDIQEKLLREEINIATLKKELIEIRKKWNKKEIEAVEIKSTNQILKHLYKYPFQNNGKGEFPKYINNTKEIQCVWYSTLAHSFLKELNIKHYGLNTGWHIALEIMIWWEKYLFDATETNKIEKFKWGKYRWKHREIILESGHSYMYAKDWGASQILQWAIVNNIWCYQQETKMENYTAKKAIQIQKSNNNYLNLSNIHFKRSITWRNNVNKKELYNTIKTLEKSIEILPTIHSYRCLWRVARKVWLWKIYNFPYKILNGNKIPTIKTKNYVIKELIEKYIKEENFDWLKEYIFERLYKDIQKLSKK